MDILIFLFKIDIYKFKLTPSLFTNISEYMLDYNQLKVLVLGGESFPFKCNIIKKIINNGVQVYNIYGITELSCWSSCHLLTLNDLEYIDIYKLVNKRHNNLEALFLKEMIKVYPLENC